MIFSNFLLSHPYNQTGNLKMEGEVEEVEPGDYVHHLSTEEAVRSVSSTKRD
jgi:hypothetical protein